MTRPPGPVVVPSGYQQPTQEPVVTKEREPYFRIGVGILVLAIVPPIFIAQIEPGDWLTNLHNWQTGLGAFWGALFGLCAILVGALLNFDLNRKRDDRLKEQDARSLAAALLGEISAAYITCAAFVSAVNSRKEEEYEKNWLDEKINGTNFGPHVTTPVFQANCDRLGLLGKKLVTEIVITYSFLFDYGRIAKKEQVITRQGLLADQARYAKDLGDRLIDLKETMQILDAFIEGGHDKAAPVGLRVTEGREVRRKKLGQELGITSD